MSRPDPPTVGVLALQGDVAEHLRMLTAAGARALPVRRESELTDLDGLVIPGGESTTIVRLAAVFDLLEPLRRAVKGGLATFGSCAGMILLAERIIDGAEAQQSIGGLDVTVRRNAFGRQVDSFEAEVEVDGLDAPFPAAFIRAPWVESTGPSVRVLARVQAGSVARIVAVRQGGLLATSFHPEIAGDDRLHRLFVAMVTSPATDPVRDRTEP